MYNKRNQQTSTKDTVRDLKVRGSYYPSDPHYFPILINYIQDRVRVRDRHREENKKRKEVADEGRGRETAPEDFTLQTRSLPAFLSSAHSTFPPPFSTPLAQISEDRGNVVTL